MEREQGWIKEGNSYELTALHNNQGQRIDKFISTHFSQYSRSFLQKLFEAKQVIINKTKTAKPGYALKTGDIVSISFPEKNKPIQKDIPQNLGVEILAKEEEFLIINKPAGLTVHPPHEESKDVTLSDWLKDQYDEIAHVGFVDRPGIVHRLDKDTSGLMIVPRTSNAHAQFTDMFKERKIQKTYLAIVLGHPPQSGTVDFLIGRHPTIKNKMHHFTELTKRPSSKHATTDYSILQYYKDFSLLEVKPTTGRTHQIRVHLSAIGFPIFADAVYGMKSKLTKRHALHAHALEFELNGKKYRFTSPLDPELQQILDKAPKE